MNAPFLHASNAYESTSHHLQYGGTQPYNGTDMTVEQVPPLQRCHHHHYSAPSLDRQTEMPSPAGTSKRNLYEPQNHQLQYGGTQPYNGADMIVEQVPPLQRYRHHHYSTPSVDRPTEMPSPAKKPPMPNFTPADDERLVNLKEYGSLTWKEIAECFPGRSAGTLQVRYCTKLKARTPQWTNETTQKLRLAIQDYEQKKWSIIAGKMGRGFTGKVCQDKANQL